MLSLVETSKSLLGRVGKAVWVLMVFGFPCWRGALRSGRGVWAQEYLLLVQERGNKRYLRLARGSWYSLRAQCGTKVTGQRQDSEQNVHHPSASRGGMEVDEASKRGSSRDPGYMQHRTACFRGSSGCWQAVSWVPSRTGQRSPSVMFSARGNAPCSGANDLMLTTLTQS